MDLQRIIEKIEKKHEYRIETVPIRDLVLITIAIVLIISEINSSFVYFFKNYYIYSFLGIALFSTGIYYSLRKQKTVTKYYYFTLTIIVLISNFWFIPKIIHYTVSKKKTLCFNATLISKNFWETSKPTGGHIVFQLEQDSSVPKNLNTFNSIEGIWDFEYRQLPSKGSNIKICGEVSKVGFDYSYIELEK